VPNAFDRMSASPCNKKNRSHTQSHNKNNTTQHTTRTTPQQHNTRHDKNNTTNYHMKNHPPALNNDRRWRGDDAYYLTHPGGEEKV